VLAEKLEYMDGWFSNDTVLWDGNTPYSPIKTVPSTTPPTITIEYESMLYCLNSYTCYLPKDQVLNSTEAATYEMI